MIKHVRYWLIFAAFLTGPIAAQMSLVSTPAGEFTLAPALAELDNNQLVLTWLEKTETGHRLYASRFDGQAFGSRMLIATGENFFANWADTPGLIALPGGDWLVHWLVKSGSATYAYDVVMARSPDQGKTWLPAFSPHSDGTLTEHGFVSYFIHDASRAGVVWLDGRHTGPAEPGGGPVSEHAHHGRGAMTLRSALVGPNGELTQETELDGQVCDCCATASAMTNEGPVVVYRNRSDNEIRDIYRVRRDDQGWSAPIAVYRDGWEIAGCPVNGPALIARGQKVVVAWFTMADNQPKVQVAVSADAGRTFSLSQTLGKGSALGRVDLAWHGDGFVASWLSDKPAGASLQLAEFNEMGSLMNQRELAMLDGGRISGFPRLGALGDGRLMVVWTATDEDRQPQVQAGMIAD